MTAGVNSGKKGLESVITSGEEKGAGKGYEEKSVYIKLGK